MLCFRVVVNINIAFIGGKLHFGLKLAIHPCGSKLADITVRNSAIETLSALLHNCTLDLKFTQHATSYITTSTIKAAVTLMMISY